MNSEAYWSERFKGDWQQRKGGEQSRFFYQLAVDHMPAWLVQMIRTEQASICDWGCATGEGTSLLAETFGRRVTGIDFSEVAIAQASNKNPDMSFMQADLLGQPTADRFDVVFTSNTLEHFGDPWPVLNLLAGYSRKAVVALVPFREYDRHPEHEFTFEENNVPVIIGDTFHLVFVQVIDTSSMTPTYWVGHQSLLVYAKRDVIQRYDLKIKDMIVDTGELSGLRRQLKEAAASSAAAEEAAEVQRRKYQRDLAALAEKANAIREAYEERLTALRQQTAAEHRQYTNELNHLREQAEADRKNHATELARVIRTFATAEAELGRAKLLIAQLQEANFDLSSSFNAEIAHLRATVDLKNSRLAEVESVLQAEHAQLSEARMALAAIRASRSWRTTAPLRQITSEIRLLRHAVIGTFSKLRRAFGRAIALPNPSKFGQLTTGSPAPNIDAEQGGAGHLLGPVSTPPASGLPAPSAELVVRAEFLQSSPSVAGSTHMGMAGVHLVPPLKGRAELADIFMWGIIDWHFRVQRPQHIARGFVENGHRVFYFSNLFQDEDEPGFRIEPISEDGLLNVVYLHVRNPPSIYFGKATPEIETRIRASVAKFLQEARPRSIMSLVQHPFWAPFADVVPNRCLVYDMMDHHDGFGDDAPEILTLEEQILRQADLVVVTSTFLENVAQAKNDSVAVVRNAAEYGHFCERPSEVFVDSCGRRVIGYYGAIASWFDPELVAHVAQTFPDDLILLIGADSVGVGDLLKSYSNIEFTGEVNYERLPYYLHGFDVCILPFKVVPLTLATNPVKVYEYLSAGKPVVSVDLPEITQFQGLVATARSYDDFAARVGEFLADPGGPDMVSARRKFASEQTWTHRIHSLRQALRNKQPRASVILVTYNKLELTHNCLQSLESNTNYPELEVIVVDNASSDGTPEYLREWARRGPNRIAILNEENRGFAAANNQGLAKASGEYMILLNNDTYVTPGWLGTLLAHLRRHPDLALVGPVTNSIGNEARIEIAYATMAEMEARALTYTSERLGEVLILRTVAFFCVALSRSTYERLGPLDEAFGIGMFEDDDYCRRAEALGMQVACAEDVFIHHHHSASFSAIAAEHRHALFLANQGIYEAKWGPWIPHTYRQKPNEHH